MASRGPKRAKVGEAEKFRFCIDRGGTFTDIYAEVPSWCSNREPRVLKLLSEDPANYENAPREGIRRILEEATGVKHPRDALVDASEIEWIRMGTTVATNGLLEREGSRFALIITRGFGDALEIGNQARPAIFDIAARKLPTLYDRVVEVGERCRVLQRGGCAGSADEALALGLAYDGVEAGARRVVAERTFEMGTSGEWVEILKPLDEAEVRRELAKVRAAGIGAVAIVFAHSYAFPRHEACAAAIARDLGFDQVSVSAELMPTVRLVPRGLTACVDAYLTPFIRTYVDSFTRGFVPGTLDLGGGGGTTTTTPGGGAKVSFMQSDGGLTPAAKFFGFKAVLSGPAGGVVGYATTTRRILRDPDDATPVIGFDMGGTSTDVSRYAGAYELVFETETAGVRIAAPQLDINTVAAGGGSRLFFRQGVFAVGPESAKAHPGPVCYRKGGASSWRSISANLSPRRFFGVLAVTDANLYLGRLVPKYFPKVFGVQEDEALDVEATRQALEALTAEVNDHLATSGPPTKVMTAAEVAAGFVEVANEAMCRPIRELSEARGLDPAGHVLACFGGAGAQHVCAIARTLGMKKAIVHSYAGVLSAYGMGLADVIVDHQLPCALNLTASAAAVAAGGSSSSSFESGAEAEIGRLQAALAERGLADLADQGFGPAKCRVERFAHLRYAGTDHGLMVPTREDATYAESMRAAFRREYGFDTEDKALLCDDVRVRCVGLSTHATREPIARCDGYPKGAPPAARETARVYFSATGWVEDARVFDLRADLLAGHAVEGPALIMNGTSTIVIEPGDTATVADEGDLIIAIAPTPSGRTSSSSSSAQKSGASSVTRAAPVDPVRLSVFSNRFMSIAEQMGRTLQRTATSVNIKERLDFSCAIFGADSGLVANAPHVPVHLGAMADTVRCQVAAFQGALRRGDVIVANAPANGGSHLPDITVITPVFFADEAQPAFYCASRGHHADVGGSTPGSMPADSTTLREEGAVIDAFLLVKRGVFDEAGIVGLLKAPATMAPPRDKPGTRLYECRNLADVLSDLKAQVAANSKGIDLLTELMRQATPAVVFTYMRHVQDNAAACVREMIRDAARRHLLGGGGKGGKGVVEHKGALTVLAAADLMDDGVRIDLRLTLDSVAGTAHFDFSGTGPQVYGNWNAPTAITTAAVIYCLRLLVGRDIPLNSGCLVPITITLPPNSLLAPSPDAAVCAGNVLTSMRITDVILRAFGAAAASQGCMNNFTFGDDNFGYYETIAGGSGAGPGWHGTSGVQCHMTNTRMTDVEIIEKRYPVLVEAFSLRRGSGGAGAFQGGCGISRQVRFLREGIVASLLTERRALAPYGLCGGGDGGRGVNSLIRDGRVIALPSKLKLAVFAGDVIRIDTPGGGGYGPPESHTTAAERLPATMIGGASPAPHGTRTASTALGSNDVEF